MPTVWVVNQSSHDYSAAKQYGTLSYLSEGPMDKYAVVDMDRQFRERLKYSAKEDYLLLTSLSIMGAIACTVFALQHNCLNLLIYKQGHYIERRLDYAHVRGV